jgi:predicted DNA-binding transcriptional regulator AlpA
MRSELQSVLDSLPRTPPEKVPELLGELELIRASALLRLAGSGTPPPQGHDELVTITIAAERLGMSRDYLYRHARKFPFTRRLGRNLRFSSLGIERYIANSKLK